MTRLVPINDAGGQLVAKLHPQTSTIHHPHTGRPVGIGTRIHREALEAMADYIAANPLPKRRRRKVRG